MYNFPWEISSNSNSSCFAKPSLSACFGVYSAPFSKALNPSIDMSRAVKLRKQLNNKPNTNHACPLLRFAYSFSVPALVFPGAMQVFPVHVHFPNHCINQFDHHTNAWEKSRAMSHIVSGGMICKSDTCKSSLLTWTPHEASDPRELPWYLPAWSMNVK